MTKQVEPPQASKATEAYAPEMYNGPKHFVHLHNHSLYSSLDGVASPDQYAKRCLDFDHPAFALTEHGHMASVPDFYLAFKKAKVKPILGCFLPEQRVLTADGITSIWAVNERTQVITDQNRPRQLLNRQSRLYDGEVVRVKAWGVEEIVATPEHPFMVREVVREEVKRGCWKETITIGMRRISDVFREKYATKRSKDRNNKRRYRFYLCVPRLQDGNLTTLDVRDWIGKSDRECTFTVVDQTVVEVVYAAPKATVNVALPVKLPLDHRLMWIMGLWLAEGTADKGMLSFWLGADEFHFYQKIADYFAEFGITTGYSFRQDRNTLDVRVHSTHFSRMFAAIFGTGFANKRIPWWMIEGLDKNRSKWLLDGLFDGDAKIGHDQSYLKLNNESLIWQARLLMTRLGQYSAITPMPCNNSDNLSYILRRREKGHFYYDFDEKYIYLPVYETRRELYSGMVYNMEVEEDNTYNVGVAVHNCEIYFNDWEPVRQDLEAKGTKVRSPDWRKANPELAARIVRNRHLTVLCKNKTGFHNLIKLTTQAYQTGLFGVSRKQFNRIWFDKLCEFKEGLIVLSGCLNGPVCHELRYKELKDKEGNTILERNEKTCVDDAVRYVKKFKKVFGDDYRFELQMPGVDGDDKVFRDSIAIADHFKIPVTLANDCHYLYRKDHHLQKIMMAIAQETTVDSPDLFHVNSDEQYMKTRAELWARFKNNTYSQGIDDRKFEEMCDNTLEVASRIEKFDFDADPKIPYIPNADDELRRLVALSLNSRGLDRDKRKFMIDGRSVTYVEQAKIELKRFIDKGFASYFLITQDLVQFGKNQGWPFSPRGSAGGSLVCFLLGIHCLDPLLWGLSFDRFLSPSRGGYMLNFNMGEEKQK